MKFFLKKKKIGGSGLKFYRKAVLSQSFDSHQNALILDWDVDFDLIHTFVIILKNDFFILPTYIHIRVVSPKSKSIKVLKGLNIKLSF
jgi:hypothetical protein